MSVSSPRSFARALRALPLLLLLLPFRAHADAYDDLRTKYVALATGNDLYSMPTSDTGLQSKLNSLDYSVSSTPTAAPNSAGNGYWDLLNHDTNRTYLWPDLTFPTGTACQSSRITSSYKRLQAMATAYATKGSHFYGNQALLQDISDALLWMWQTQYQMAYYNVATHYASGASGNNWFDWQIGAPQALTKTILLVQPDLLALSGSNNATNITNYMTAVDNFVPNPAAQTATGAPTMTAANLTDQALVVAYRGIIVKNTDLVDKIGLAQQAIVSVMTYRPGNATFNTPARDGFYEDGSFIQHSANPYIGGYGISAVSDVGTLLYLFDGSTWAITDASKWNSYKWIFDSVMPFIYNGSIMDSVVGRNVGFGPNLGVKKYNPALDGGQLIVAMYNFLLTAPTSNANLGTKYPANPLLAYKQALKYWMQTDTNGQILYYAPIYVYLQLQTIAADSSVVTSTPVGYWQYPAQDRAVHLRPAFGFALSMSSERVNSYESAFQNLRGWYTGDGMTYIYPNDPSVYYNFWQTVDPYRMPGTTVDTQSRTDAQNWINYLSPNSWTGGASLNGEYGVSGMDYKAAGDLPSTFNTLSPGPTPTTVSNLVAKKSWFMFDDEIVALGAGITNTGQNGLLGRDGATRRVETIIDNHRILDANTNVLSVNGTPQSTTPGWTATLSGTNWIYLQGNTGSDVSSLGYYFPQGATVKALRETRTGDYTPINPGYANKRVIPPAADTYVRSGDSAHGSDPSMDVKDDIGNYTRESYIKFDLTNFIQDTNVTFDSAIVTITPVSIGGTTNTLTHTAELVAAADNGWTEAGLVWTNKPASSPLSPAQSWSNPTIYTPVNIDITNALRAALANGTKVISLRIYATTPPDSAGIDAYATKENTTSSYRPTLTLNNYKEPVSSNFVTLWLDHGTDPSNASYEYAILPAMNSAAVQAYATTPDFAVLRNDSTAQEVQEKTLAMVGANVWQDGSLTLQAPLGQNFITVDKKCSVLTRESVGALEVAISDPTQHNTGSIDVEIFRSASGTIGTVDPTITITQLSPSIKYSVNVNGTYGRSIGVKFALPVTLTPTGDAYVYDGSASQNYGTATSLAVKNDAATYNRKAYIQFDVTGMTVPPNSAVITVYPTSVAATGLSHQASAVTSAWAEGTITWNDQPTVAGSAFATWTVPAVLQPVTIDVTSLVQAAVTGTNKTVSIQISAVTYGSTTNVSYASKEYGTTAYRPVLKVN